MVKSSRLRPLLPARCRPPETPRPSPLAAQSASLVRPGRMPVPTAEQDLSAEASESVVAHSAWPASYGQRAIRERAPSCFKRGAWLHHCRIAGRWRRARVIREWLNGGRTVRVRGEIRCRRPRRATRRAVMSNVAYQVLGEGPIDLVYVWGWISHLDFQWTNPTIESFLRRVASFSRLIMFDKRGTGLSDPVGAAPTFEERTDDVRAVMDAVGSERAALLRFSEGAALSVLFAATYPDRTTALILYDGIAVGGLVEEGRPDPEWTESAMRIQETIDRWGEGETMRWIAPSLVGSAMQKRFLGDVRARVVESGNGPFAWDAIQRMDVRAVLPTIRWRRLCCTTPTVLSPPARCVARAAGSKRCRQARRHAAWNRRYP